MGFTRLGVTPARAFFPPPRRAAEAFGPLLAVSAFLSHLFTFVLVYHMNMCGTIDRLYMWYRLYEFGVSLTCLFWCARFQLRHVAANGATLDTACFLMR